MSKLLTIMTFIVALTVQALAENRKFNAYDVSILLKATPVEGFGQLPHLDFDFNQIKHVPIFNQKPNKVQKNPVSGLINSQSEQQILSTFEQLPGTDPLSFPFKAIVLGLRVDPCAGKSCENQIRLIAEDPDLEDRSAHLIYNFSDESFRKFLTEIKSLNNRCKNLSINTSLKVHPCSADSAYVSEFNRVLKKYCTEDSLKKVAFQIRTSDNPEIGAAWIFAAAEKTKDRSWHIIKTRSAPHGEEFFAFGGSGLFDDVQKDKLDLQVIQGLTGNLNDNERAALVAQLENFNIQSVDNTSCMSCHSSQALRAKTPFLKKENLDYFRISKMERAGSFVPGSADIRHFGYRFGVPKISSRVINETNRAVDYLNSDLNN